MSSLAAAFQSGLSTLPHSSRAVWFMWSRALCGGHGNHKTPNGTHHYSERAEGGGKPGTKSGFFILHRTFKMELQTNNFFFKHLKVELLNINRICYKC